MNLYIARDGQSLGPYTDLQAREYVKSGIFGADDLACQEGREEWLPLKGYLAAQKIANPPTLPTSVAKSTNGERVFFQEAGVSVTSTRFVVGRQTYAMRNITSVQPLVVPAKQGGAILLIIFALVVGLVGLENSSPLGALFGGGILVLGIIWFRSEKDTFGVLLRTSGGEVRAIEHKSEAFIDKIVQAINDSIVSHG